MKMVLTFDGRGRPVVVRKTVTVEIQSAEQGIAVSMPDLSGIFSQEFNQQIIDYVNSSGEVFTSKNANEFRRFYGRTVEALVLSEVNRKINEYLETNDNNIFALPFDEVIYPEQTETD